MELKDAIMKETLWDYWKVRIKLKEVGLIEGHSSRSPQNIQRSKSKTERAWYTKGVNNHWLKQFPFARERFQKSPYDSIEKWARYGREHNYSTRNPSSFRNR